MKGLGGFRSLSAFLALSLVFVGLTQALDLNQVWGMFLSCAPLFAYHWLVLATRPRGSLSQSEIDSVYYFGFLVTIASLAAGVFFFQRADAPDAADVGSLLRQFAVGIAATAYAVFARMHLASRNVETVLDDAQGLLNAQVLQVQDILHQMTSASVAAQTLTSSIEAARDQLVSHSTKEISFALSEVSRQFSIHLSASLNNLNVISEQVRSSLAAINELTVEQGIPRALREIASASKSLSENTSAAASASLEAATAISMLGREFAGMQGVVAAGRASLADVEVIGSTLRSFDAAAASASHAVHDSAAALVNVTAQMRDVGDHISTAPRTVKRLADQVARTAEGMDFLSGVAGKLDAAATGLSKAADAADSLVSGFDSLSRIAPQLSSDFQRLSSGTEESARSVSAFGTAADSVIASVSRLESAVTIMDRGNEGVAQLLTDVKALSAGVAALSAQLVRSEQELVGATGKLSSVAQSASVSLQKDLEAATGSAVEVARRLVTLVNSIIEQTNRQQADRR